MKKLLVLVILNFPLLVFSQGKSISLAKRIKDPYVTLSKDTIKVEQEVMVATGSNPDGSFKYVQLLNGMNEPVKAAESRVAMKRQNVKFFKEEDGVFYAFTKFFAINIEAALMVKEIILIK